MALIQCPECGHEVSDSAKNCPNCGCPISEEQTSDNSPQSRGGGGRGVAVFFGILLIVLGFIIATSKGSCESCVSLTGTGTIRFEQAN